MVRRMASSFATPLTVRAAIGTLTLAASASLIYGATRAMQAVRPDISPYPVVDSAVDTGFSALAVIGYGAAAYGLATRRWGARQLGLLVSGACLPYGAVVAVLAYVNALGTSWDSPQGRLLLAANCIAITAALCGALLGLASLARRSVAEYLASAAPFVAAGQLHRKVLHSRILLSIVAVARAGTVCWFVAFVLDGISNMGEVPPNTRMPMFVVLMLLFLVLLAPTVLALPTAVLLPRYPGTRRVAMAGLWLCALTGVPLMVLVATFVGDAPGLDSMDWSWTLVMASVLLFELIAAAAVVAAALRLKLLALQRTATNSNYVFDKYRVT